jgi:hypothetical protein
VTEVGLPRLTALLISLEDPVGFSGRPRGRPSKCWAGNQRDQCESSDERLHDTSPLVTELTSPLDISARLPISLAPNCCKTVAPASVELKTLHGDPADRFIVATAIMHDATHSYEVYREIELRIRWP